MKDAEAPTLEWFRSLAAIADALTVLESQCMTMGFGTVAEKVRIAKAEIAAAADIIQSQAYDQLESDNPPKDGGSATKH